jgi:hypothetical protein
MALRKPTPSICLCGGRVNENEHAPGMCTLCTFSELPVSGLYLLAQQFGSFDRSNIRPICAILTCMSGSSTGDQRAMNILRELHAAEEELIGRAVAMADGKAGSIEHVYLDDVHGLRISIGGHEGRWPISTVKFIES